MPRHSVISSRASRVLPPPATYGGAPLRRVFTDATDSDVTADDLVGAGRVVGNWLSSGGKHIVTLCTRLSLMFGGGPNKPLRTLLKSLQCSFCAKPYFGTKAMLPPRDAPADFVLRELFICSRSCAFCGATRGFKMSSAKKASKAGKAFTSILIGSNCSSQYTAILFITALASLLPDLPAIFTKHNTTRALALLRSRVTQQPDKDLDFLLAPSRCALAVLGELEIHLLGKDIVALTERVSHVETWKSFKDLTGHRLHIYKTRLIPFWKSSQTAIFMAMIIRTGIRGDGFDFASSAGSKWPINHFYEEQWTNESELDYPDLALHLAHSGDPVLNSMLPALLIAIRETLIAQFRLEIQYDIGKGRTPRKLRRTLDILRGPDWKRFLRSDFGLIDREDEEFMEYALEEWWDLPQSDEDADDVCADGDTEGEEKEIMSAQMEKNDSVSVATMTASDQDTDDYVSALSVLGDDAADVDGADLT